MILTQLGTATFALYGSSGAKPCGVFEDGTIKFFDNPSEISFVYYPERMAAGDCIIFNKIKVPEYLSQELEITITDKFRGSIGPLKPNYNYEIICGGLKFSSPEIKFKFFDVSKITSLSRLVLDYEVGRY